METEEKYVKGFFEDISDTWKGSSLGRVLFGFFIGFCLGLWLGGGIIGSLIVAIGFAFGFWIGTKLNDDPSKL